MKRRASITTVTILIAAFLLLTGNAFAKGVPQPAKWPKLDGATIKYVGEYWWEFSILKTKDGNMIAARQTEATEEELPNENPFQGVIVVNGKAYGNITESLYKKTLSKKEGFKGIPYKMIRNDKLTPQFAAYIQKANNYSHAEEIP